jgi:hypothetical protein
MAPVVVGAKALVRGDVAARRRDTLLTIFMMVWYVLFFERVIRGQKSEV